MSIIIPAAPQELELRVERLWNGEVCPDDRLWAELRISKDQEGLRVRARAPMLHEQRVPNAPIGTRVDGLWEYDVVELFLVGPGHQYVELELGAGGHWLLLSFDSIRHRRDAHESFEPIVRFSKTPEKIWTSELVIPWRMIPENLRAINAFSIMAGQFMALSPTPGSKPDFHQPDSYPAATL